MPGFGNILRNNGLVFRGTQWNAQQHEIYEEAFVIFRTEKLQWLLALKVAGVLLHCNTCGGLFSSRTKCAVLALVWHHTTPTLCSIEDMSKVPKSMQWPRMQLWKSLKQENSCSGNQVWTETSARCLLRFLLHWATSSPPITKSLCGIQLNCQVGLAQSGRLRVFSQTQPVNFRGHQQAYLLTLLQQKKKKKKTAAKLSCKSRTKPTTYRVPKPHAKMHHAYSPSRAMCRSTLEANSTC